MTIDQSDTGSVVGPASLALAITTTTLITVPETIGVIYMSEASGKVRPEHRNIGVGEILKYRLPLAGIASILHRISGALLFLVGIPLILYMLQLSLTSEVSYAAFETFADNILVKLILLVLIWAFLHHLCAGIRYLLLDLHIGVSKEASALSAKIVLGVSLVLTVIAMLKLFGAY